MKPPGSAAARRCAPERPIDGRREWAGLPTTGHDRRSFLPPTTSAYRARRALQRSAVHRQGTAQCEGYLNRPEAVLVQYADKMAALQVWDRLSPIPHVRVGVSERLPRDYRRHDAPPLHGADSELIGALRRRHRHVQAHGSFHWLPDQTRLPTPAAGLFVRLALGAPGDLEGRPRRSDAPDAWPVQTGHPARQHDARPPPAGASRRIIDDCAPDLLQRALAAATHPGTYLAVHAGPSACG